jgi:hypothetical protein
MHAARAGPLLTPTSSSARFRLWSAFSAMPPRLKRDMALGRLLVSLV